MPTSRVPIPAGSSPFRKVLVCSHAAERVTGWDDPFCEHLLACGVAEVVRLQFPFQVTTVSRIRIASHQPGRPPTQRSFPVFHRPHWLAFVRDFVYGIWFGVRHGRGADLFVGLNNLLVVAGLVLRSCGVVRQVAYTMVDYTPRRYPQGFLNALYWRLDRWACHAADVVWPLHRRMLEGRAAHGRINLARVRWVEAPFGHYGDRYCADPPPPYQPHCIAYLGGVLKLKGAELFVPIVRRLLELGVADVTFTCVGGGELDWLRGEIQQAGLQSRFQVHGQIEDEAVLCRLLQRCGVAIAPYYSDDPNSYSYFADSGKIKVYLGCGLPVVVTDVPPIARSLAEGGCGLIAAYAAEDFAAKILTVLRDQEEFRQRARRCGATYAWPVLFDSLLAQSRRYLQDRPRGQPRGG